MSTPSDKVRALDRLVGKWQITGGSAGTVTYEWAMGGFFLLQHVELEQDGDAVTGLEVIGHLHPFGGEQSENVHSRYYGSGGGTFEYVYEMEGDSLTIWAGDKGSPAYFRGTFNDDDSEMVGAWVYPGGGGYDSTMTRIS